VSGSSAGPRELPRRMLQSPYSELTWQAVGAWLTPSGGWRDSPGSGGPGESHPRAPTERSVTVSRHSALVILIISGYLTHFQWAKSLGYCVVTRSQATRAFRWARNRWYFLRIQRIR